MPDCVSGEADEGEDGEEEEEAGPATLLPLLLPACGLDMMPNVLATKFPMLGRKDMAGQRRRRSKVMTIAEIMCVVEVE